MGRTTGAYGAGCFKTKPNKLNCCWNWETKSFINVRCYVKAVLKKKILILASKPISVMKLVNDFK